MKATTENVGAEPLKRAHKRYPLQFYLLIAFIFFISPLSIGFSDNQAHITVANKTDHFLHVFIDGAPYLYVAPLRSVTKEAAKTTFSVTAFYAPGQGVSGTIDTTLTVSEYTPPSTTTGCDHDHNDNSGCDCSHTTTPADYGSTNLEITAEIMTVESSR